MKFWCVFLLSPFMGQQQSPLMTNTNAEDLVVLKELIEAGKVKPFIDEAFPLGETPDAFRYMENEHPRGKVVITVLTSIQG